ncbi:MAG: class I SAM-dependent methyltransferase [Pseudomonadota bacterium]
MPEAEFDRHAATYHRLHAENVALSGEEPAYFAQYKVAYLKQLLRGETVNRILDFGAGTGASTPYFTRFFPSSQIHCLDVSEKSLDLAREKHGASAQYQLFDGCKIPYGDDHFDVVFTACVFHHVERDRHRETLKELWRVTKRQGRFFLFEHNPWNPLTVHAVNTCPFDENAELIAAPAMRRRVRQAGFAAPHIAYCVFFPKALAWLRPLEKYLSWLPLGAQYLVHARK